MIKEQVQDKQDRGPGALSYKGTGVSQGIGIGRAYIIREEKLLIPEYTVSDVKKEIKRYDQAVGKYIQITEEKSKSAGENEAGILLAHCTIAADPELKNAIEEILELRKINVEIAVNEAFDNVIEVFASMDDGLLAERAQDLRDVKNKILRILMELPIEDFSEIPGGSILAANELTPSMTASIDPLKVAGFITKTGGTSSHTAIIARSLGIPAIVGVDNLLEVINETEELIIDGKTGEIYINPDENTKNEFREKKNRFLEQKSLLKKYKGVKTETKDGRHVGLWANVGSVFDVERALENGAEGVGLFRTEFLYMESQRLPSEEEQFEVYMKAARVLEGKPLVIRTLDVGGDKEIPYLGLVKEENPYLGFRAVRYSLKNTCVFKEQIRAILRASVFGKIRIMIPMISDVSEFYGAKNIIDDVKKELKGQDILFNENIMVGMMIETPAAAMCADIMGACADFFSIGTNDLTQYTMAVDRGNENVAELYTHYSPAVLRLIKHTIESAKTRNIPVGICGEAGSDPLFIPFLLALGIDEISVNPSVVLETRKLISEININSVKEEIDGLLRLPSAGKVKEYLTKLLL